MKRMLLFGVVLCLIVVSIGCGKISLKKEKKQSTATSDEIGYTKEFGEYKVLSNWEENKEHSTSEKFFYVKKGTGHKEQPNNIAVSVGTNRYSSEESEDFKESIRQQLSEQIAQFDDTTMTSEAFTGGENTVYLFTITEEETGLVTNQYYIVGEKKYCLVQESNFNKNKECNEVARRIVESFKWK